MSSSNNSLSDRYSNSLLYNLLIRPFYYGYFRFRELLDPALVNLIAFCTLLAICLSFIAASLIDNQINVTEEHRLLFNIQDSTTQRYFYVLLTLFVFIGGLLQGVLKKDLSYSFVGKTYKLSPLIFKTLASSLVLFLTISLLSNYLDTILDKRAFFSTITVAIIFSSLLAFRNTYKGTFILIVLLGIQCLFFYILPLSWTYEIGAPNLWAFDHHWSGVVGYSFIQANFPSLETNLFPQYGVYLNTILGIFFELPAFSAFNGAITLFQLFNILFSILLLSILIQRCGRENLKLALLIFSIVILAFAPYIASSATTIPVPNQAPIRFIFIPITILLSYFLFGKPVVISWTVAGVLSMVAMSYNLETGIACTLGLGFSLFIEALRKGVIDLLVGVTFYIVSAIMSFYVLFNIAPFYFSNFPALNLTNLTEVIGLFSEGYGGKRFFWYLPIFVIMGHCLYLFARGLTGLRETVPLSPKDLQTYTIVGVIIAFFPYVANRFFITNMWVPILLYLLMVLPKVKYLVPPKQLLAFCSIILILLPFQLKETSLFIKQSKHSWETSTENTCIFGIKGKNELCNYVKNQAEELKNYTKNNVEPLWISGIPLTISILSGIPPRQTVLDLFSAARTESTHTRVLTSVSKQNPNVIMIDRIDHHNPTGTPTHISNWQKRLIKQLGYKVTHQSDYWIYASKNE